MNEYQQEQLDALDQIADKLGSIDSLHSGELADEVRTYLLFRQDLDKFLNRHFADFCTRECFESQMSACCSKDGIITFWGDVVINVFHSTKSQIFELFSAIQKPLMPNKCIYLGKMGCLWKVRPLGCALFLCDGVQDEVLAKRSELIGRWHDFIAKAKSYRWPDRPVLFDRLEQVFMAAGCRSTLMYINTSPGLLRIKQKAGLV